MYRFEWEHCNYNMKAKRWVKIASKERPGMIQLCHADGRNKCLIATNQSDEVIKNYVLLENYQNTAKVSPAQLWKWNNQSRQLMNVEYSSCLVEIGTKTSPTIWLITTQCGENDFPSFQKQWDLKPIMGNHNSRVCADFQIPQKGPVDKMLSLCKPSSPSCVNSLGKQGAA